VTRADQRRPPEARRADLRRAVFRRDRRGDCLADVRTMAR